jgi:hypothetical protein
MDRTAVLFVGSALAAAILGSSRVAGAQEPDGEEASEPAVAAPAARAAEAEPEGDAVEPVATRSVATRSGPEAAGSSEWKFDYHGYFRAPMRAGIGKREVPPGWEVDGASDTTLHTPVIPDDQFLSFQSTPHNKRDWAELFVTIGNSWASGTVAIQGYNFAEAAWNETDLQFGIAQGYVTITPDFGFDRLRLALKAGAFSDKYGQAGRYDAGEYDTYLFGRTHNAGYTLHVDYDLDDSNTVYVEQGIGTKRPDPSFYNSARFTLLNHVHAGFRRGRDLEFGAHYLHAWTQEDDRTQGSGSPAYLQSRTGLPDGKLWVAGVEARAELGAFGYVYAGFSHIEGKYAMTVAPIIEVLHSQGGAPRQLSVPDNYFDAPGCGRIRFIMDNEQPVGLRTDGCSDGTGSINAILAQYEFSLANFLRESQGEPRFSGDGEDLRLILYGLYAMVQSDSYDTTTSAGATAAAPLGYEVNKLKFGGDLTWVALPWLSPGLRFDQVQPNSNVSEQSFAILSPRLTFTSRFLTREQISFQYSRYFYAQRECNPVGTVEQPNFDCVQPPSVPVPYEGFGSFPNGQETGNRATGGTSSDFTYEPLRIPDVNVFKVEASMWW